MMKESIMKMDLFLGLGRCFPVWRKKQNKEAKGSSVLTAWGCRADGSPGWEAHFSGRTEALLASQGSEITKKCSPAPAAHSASCRRYGRLCSQGERGDRWERQMWDQWRRLRIPAHTERVHYQLCTSLHKLKGSGFAPCCGPVMGRQVPYRLCWHQVRAAYPGCKAPTSASCEQVPIGEGTGQRAPPLYAVSNEYTFRIFGGTDVVVHVNKINKIKSSNK